MIAGLKPYSEPSAVVGEDSDQVESELTEAFE